MKKLVILLSFLIIITGCKDKNENLEKNIANLNEGVIKNTQINDLYMTNTSLIYESGISTFKVDIENKGIAIDKKIKIVFKNKNGSIITTLISNLVTFNQSETNTLLLSTDYDLTNAYSLEYIVE